MNSRAKRISLELPPNLHLGFNRLEIDDTLKNAERCNAPYINGQLQPLWKREYDTYRRFDTYGNSYTIEDGWFERNGEKLFEIEEQHFEQTDITEEIGKHLSYDIHGASLDWDEISNTATLTYQDYTFTTPSIFTNGSIITSRVRVVNNTPIGVIFYSDDSGAFKYLYMSNSIPYHIGDVVWRRQSLRTSATATYSPSEVTISNPFPLIQIAVVEGVPIVSLVSRYGEVLASNSVGYFTFGVYNNSFYENVLPVVSTNTAEITDTITSNFTISLSQSSTISNKSLARVVNSDGSFKYYDWNGSLGEEVQVPSNQQVTSTTEIITIDGIEYTICTTAVAIVESEALISSSNSSITWRVMIDDVSSESNNQSQKSIVYQKVEIFYPSEPIEYMNPSSIQIEWNGEIDTIPNLYWNTSPAWVSSRSTTTTQTVSFAAAPNVFLDDGTCFSLWHFNPTQAYAASTYIDQYARVTSWTVSSGVLRFNFIATEIIPFNSTMRYVASTSFVIGQNWFVNTTRTSNSAPSSSYASHQFEELTISNTTGRRWFPGTTDYAGSDYNGEITRYTTTWIESYPVFVVAGYRNRIDSTNFNILNNVYTTAGASTFGLSYGSGSSMGTLLTEVTGVDSGYYISATDTELLYRNRMNRYIKISIEEGATYRAELQDRFIVINTTSYWNCWDSLSNIPYHYATDYNGRVLFGITSNSMPTYKSSVGTSILTGDGINPRYEILPRNPVSSTLLPAVSRYRVTTGSERAFNCEIPESTYNQGIDIFYGTTDSTAGYYRYTIYPYRIPIKSVSFNLEGSTYPMGTTGSYFNSDIFARYIRGTGNSDWVKSGAGYYSLVYDSDRPTFLYNASGTRLDNVDSFFVLQGQFYAVINEKLYSLIYSNNAISEMDAIIDVRGLKFVGNTPTLAFFWSPSNREFRSFSGDANLRFIFDGSKIESLSGDYWYDETTQSIWIATSAGLLCIGPQNTYLLEDLRDVYYMEFSDDGVTHVMNSDGSGVDLVYYKRDGYESNHVILETSFYGFGNTESTSIDRWNISLYSQDRQKSDVVCSVRTITDVSTNSEKKTLTINPNQWDEWASSVLISYSPKLIKGQGIRLSIDTRESIQSVVPHIVGNNTGTLTSKGM